MIIEERCFDNTMKKQAKIAIITFQNSHNCGSMLQALALQHVLKEKFNVDNEIIDFSNAGQQAMYKPFWKVTGLKQLVKNILWLTVLIEILKQRNAYTAFGKKYFKLSKSFYSDNKDLYQLNAVYDKYITGSDQVWNIKCMDADDAYYLNFVNQGMKYAYAVSFGANNPFADKETRNHYLDLVNDFNRISVREQNAKIWIEEATGRKVSLCLDPTMLLNQKEWEKLVEIRNTPIIEGNYIFYYCFSISQKIAKFLNHISKKTGMPVYFLEPKEWALRCCWKNKIHLVGQYGPEAFINVVKYASIFFTTSFHGTAFSTIFHKNFWYINSGNNDLSKDDRAVSFLSQLGLINRYKTIKELEYSDLSQVPDYDLVEEKLHKLKVDSMDYIRSIVND